MNRNCSECANVIVIAGDCFWELLNGHITLQYECFIILWTYTFIYTVSTLTTNTTRRTSSLCAGEHYMTTLYSRPVPAALELVTSVAHHPATESRLRSCSTSAVSWPPLCSLVSSVLTALESVTSAIILLRSSHAMPVCI